MVKRDQVVCGYLRKLRVRVRGGGCGLRKSHLRNLGMFYGWGRARQGQARILLPRCSKANQKREWEAGQAQAGAHAPMVGRRCCLSVRDGRACLLLSGASSEGRSIPGRYCTTVVVQSLKAASAARDASLGQVGVGLG